MAGWDDYGIGPGGQCRGVPLWTVVEGLVAAYNERISYMADDPSESSNVFFEPYDLDASAPSTPGHALLRFFSTRIYWLFCGKRGSYRPFFDGTAFRLSDPTGLEQDTDGFSILTEDKSTQTSSNRSWLASYMGVPGETDAETMFVRPYWFREWQPCVSKIYGLINGWRWHYEICSFQTGRKQGALGHTRQEAWENAKAAPMDTAGSLFWRSRNTSSIGPSAVAGGHLSYLPSQVDPYESYVQAYDGADYALTPNRADSTIIRLEDCAVSALYIPLGTSNWSAYDAEFPAGAHVAVAFPANRKINLVPNIYDMDDLGEGRDTAVSSLRFTTVPMCVYDMSGALSFWRDESA